MTEVLTDKSYQTAKNADELKKMIKEYPKCIVYMSALGNRGFPRVGCNPGGWKDWEAPAEWTKIFCNYYDVNRDIDASWKSSDEWGMQGIPNNLIAVKGEVVKVF